MHFDSEQPGAVIMGLNLIGCMLLLHPSWGITRIVPAVRLSVNSDAQKMHANCLSITSIKIICNFNAIILIKSKFLLSLKCFDSRNIFVYYL